MMVRPPHLDDGANALWDWLERRGMTQRQMAEKVGIDHTYLNHILCGRRKPGLGTAIRIERATGVAVEEWDSTHVDKRKIVTVGKPRKQ